MITNRAPAPTHPRSQGGLTGYAGIAAGSQKPTLLVMDERTDDSVVLGLAAFPIVRMGNAGAPSLRYGLEAYVRNVLPLAKKYGPEWTSPEIPLASSSPALSRTDIGMGFEREVFAKLASLGAIVDQQRQDSAFDGVASLPGLGDPWNPIAIQCKSFRPRRNSNSLTDNTMQFLKRLQTSSLHLGLLIYLELEDFYAPMSLASHGRSVTVIDMPILQSLSGDAFGEILKKMRNDLAHKIW